MAYSLHKHLRYNAWANRQFADLLSKVDDVVYFLPAKSSFASIAKTIIHMWGAQDVWYRRLQGESLGSFPTRDETDRQGALDGLVQSSTAILKFLESKDDNFLASLYAYKNLKGDPCEDSYEDTLFHIVNHNTYHRGQIITMLREGGVTSLVGTDLIHYLRTLKK